MNNDLKRNYIKLRLDDWGRWENTEESFNHLRYRSFMGRLIQSARPIKALTLCEFECEQVGIIMARLKKINFKLYEIGLLYFVEYINPKDISKKRQMGLRTVYDTLNRLYKVVGEGLEVIEDKQEFPIYNCAN